MVIWCGCLDCCVDRCERCLLAFLRQGGVSWYLQGTSDLRGYVGPPCPWPQLFYTGLCSLLCVRHCPDGCQTLMPIVHTTMRSGRARRCNTYWTGVPWSIVTMWPLTVLMGGRFRRDLWRALGRKGKEAGKVGRRTGYGLSSDHAITWCDARPSSGTCKSHVSFEQRSLRALQVVKLVILLYGWGIGLAMLAFYAHAQALSA